MPSQCLTPDAKLGNRGGRHGGEESERRKCIEKVAVPNGFDGKADPGRERQQCTRDGQDQQRALVKLAEPETAGQGFDFQALPGPFLF